MSEGQPPSRHSSQKSWVEKIGQLLTGEPQDLDDLLEILRDARENHLLDTDALSMIEGALQVSQLRVRDIMIPRVQMVVVPKDAELDTLFPLVTQFGHSRYPVIEEDRSKVVGILLVQDLFAQSLENKHLKVHQIMRPVILVPESKRLNVLLKELRTKGKITPTGAVHGEADFEVVASVAREHDLVVITDEVYERVVWGNRRHTSLATRAGMRERTVTVMGLTKTFAMGGWRIGFVFAPPSLAEAMVTLQQHLITCPNSFVQAGAARAFGEPPRPEVLDTWRDWERRCAYLTGEIGALPGVHCAMPEGGFYAWADIRRLDRPSSEVAEMLLREHQVAVVPGAAFGATGEGYLRLTCVRSWDDLRAAVPRLKKALAA